MEKDKTRFYVENDFDTYIYSVIGRRGCRDYFPEQGPIDTNAYYPQQGPKDATINRHYLICYWVDVMAYVHNNQLGPLCILIVVTTNWLIMIVSMDYQPLGTIYASTTHTTNVTSQ